MTAANYDAGQFSAGPPQGKLTPSGGSAVHEVTSVGATSPLVKIRNLKLEASTQRGTAHILRGVDLDIGRGRILGVVGESGSGKSSLASCLLRLLPGNITHLGGQIEFDGTDLLKLDDATMAGWRGRRIAVLVVVGFVLLVFSYAGLLTSTPIGLGGAGKKGAALQLQPPDREG